MELRNDTNDTLEEQYESRPNPNDALFGGMSSDEPYQVTSTYTGNSKKKGNGGAIIGLVIALMVVAVAVFVVNNIMKEKNKYNGYYEMTQASYMGVTADVDQLEILSGMTVEASLEIDGDYGYLDVNYNGHRESGSCKVTIEDASITLGDASGTVHGIYDEGTQTITLYTEGADLIFEKVE